MSLEQKLLESAEYERRAIELNKEFEAVLYGGEFERGGDITQNPLYFARQFSNTWQGVAFPEGFNFVLELKDVPTAMNGLLFQATGVKTATLICNVDGTTNLNQLIRESSVEVLDLSAFKPAPNSINYFLHSCQSIVTIIGELDLSNCTSATYSFNVRTLKDIRFKEGTIGISLAFNNCTQLSAESLNSIMRGLSSTATEQTLTLPKYDTVKATFDAKFGANSWDTTAATKPNWTIAYS